MALISATYFNFRRADVSNHFVGTAEKLESAFPSASFEGRRSTYPNCRSPARRGARGRATVGFSQSAVGGGHLLICSIQH
jgi:hypothetical protein